MSCIACGSTDQSRFPAREMMYGTRERFDYLECASCGTLQIAEAPDDLGRFYPGDYYSFAPANFRPEPALKALAKRIPYEMLSVPAVARAYSRRRPNSRLAQALRYRLRRGDRLLDVGCGAGSALDLWARFGFPKPLGVDLFLSENLDYPSGASVRAAGIADTDGRFDAIMFHHSLEHVPDPIESLRHARRLLSDGGRLVVRLPTSSSEAFRRYGANWVQLDPPRHLVIPSRLGMMLLGEKAGLRLVTIADDSSAFQFWGSEQYVRDVPLRQDGDIKPAEALFSDVQLDVWEREAAELNRQSRGDQAIFIFEAETGRGDVRRPASRAEPDRTKVPLAGAAV